MSIRNQKPNIVLAITGASGAIYAQMLLEKLTEYRDQIGELAVVLSDNAKTVWKFELDQDFSVPEGIKLYDKNDFYAPFASGSSNYNTLIICPSSMGTLGRIAHGISNDLITRAADVMLKERRKLIIVPRETPYNTIHLKNLLTLSEAGAIICPASPSFYSKPKDHRELALTVVNRVLDLAGIDAAGYRWG